jgi:hypothetical protein
MTKTMTKTMSVTVGAILAMAMLLPAAASAQPKLVHYFAVGPATIQPATGQPATGQEAAGAAERFTTGDTSAIPAIEKPFDGVMIAQPFPKP